MVTKKCRVQDIQSVAGGWIVGKDDKLYTYVSGRASNMALDQTGLLTLRRDGKQQLALRLHRKPQRSC